jgi:hypothetical protein
MSDTKVYVQASNTDKDVQIALTQLEWAFKNATRTHDDIGPGQLILLYTSESQEIRAVGVITSFPDMNRVCKDAPWAGTWYHPFTFKVIAQGAVGLKVLAGLPSLVESGGQFSSATVPHIENAPAKLTQLDILAITEAMSTGHLPKWCTDYCNQMKPAWDLARLELAYGTIEELEAQVAALKAQVGTTT